MTNSGYSFVVVWVCCVVFGYVAYTSLYVLYSSYLSTFITHFTTSNIFGCIHINISLTYILPEGTSIYRYTKFCNVYAVIRAVLLLL